MFVQIELHHATGYQRLYVSPILTSENFVLTKVWHQPHGGAVGAMKEKTSELFADGARLECLALENKLHVSEPISTDDFIVELPDHRFPTPQESVLLTPSA